MEYVLPGLYFLFFSFAAYAFSTGAYKSLYLHWRGIATTGTVVELIRDEGKGADDGITYAPVVAFSTKEGVQVLVKSTFRSLETGSYFRVGEQVRIRYSAKDPTVCAIEGYEVAGVFGMFIVSALLFALFWYSLRDI